MRAVQLAADWDPKPEYDVSDREREQRFAYQGSNAWRNPEISVETIDEPSPDADEVLVDVWFTGICGSDLHMAESDDDGYMKYSSFASLPNTTGHEFAGIVAETGADVTQFSAGDLVTSEVTEYCGVCEMCRRSLPFQCPNIEEIGFTKPGSHAEYVTVPEKNVWDVSPLAAEYETTEACLRAAATIEPTSISYFGLHVRADDVDPGAYYVFHGGGPIGLTGMNVAKASGASRIILVEPIDERRDLARDMGFEHVIDPTAVDAAAEIMELTDGHGADVQVEAAGAPKQTYPVIQRVLGPEGTVVHLGISHDEGGVSFDDLQSRHAAIHGSEGHTGNGAYPRVIRLLANGQIDNDPLITDVYELSEAPAAFERAQTRAGGKILLDCR